MKQRKLTIVGWGAVATFLGRSVAMPAQGATAPHLTIGVAAGWVGGGSLWDVPAQTIRSVRFAPDLFHLHRDLGAGVSLSGHATYFRNAHFGLAGEFTFVGLNNADRCTVTQDGGDPGLLSACNAIAGSPSSVSSTTVQAGVILRPFGDTPIQSYAKGLAGLAFTPGSTVAMRSFYNSGNVLTVYEDDRASTTRPTWTLAVGALMSIGRGYQLLVEARESWLTEARITGPTTAQGEVPPSHSSYKAFPSLFVGFDIVLEQRRGRQY